MGESRCARAEFVIRERHSRFAAVRSQQELTSASGLVASVLRSEVRETAESDPSRSRFVRRIEERFLDETGRVKASMKKKKRLLKKFRVAAIAAVFARSKRRSKGRREEVRKNPELSPRARALDFVKKVQRGAITDESPAVVDGREKRLKDVAVAEQRMYASGELTRLKELRARQHLDDIEVSVLQRLEAKLQGMVFAAEIDRKDAETRERKKQRLRRIDDNEKKFAEAKILAKLQRNATIEKNILKPIRHRLRSIRHLSGKTTQKNNLKTADNNRTLDASYSAYFHTSTVFSATARRLPTLPSAKHLKHNIQASTRRAFATTPKSNIQVSPHTGKASTHDVSSADDGEGEKDARDNQENRPLLTSQDEHNNGRGEENNSNSIRDDADHRSSREKDPPKSSGEPP